VESAWVIGSQSGEKAERKLEKADGITQTGDLNE